MNLFRTDPSDTFRDKALRAAAWVAIIIVLAVVASVAGPWSAGVMSGR